MDLTGVEDGLVGADELNDVENRVLSVGDELVGAVNGMLSMVGELLDVVDGVLSVVDELVGVVDWSDECGRQISGWEWRSGGSSG